MICADEKYLSLAALMTDMSEDLISESDIRSTTVIKTKCERTNRFSAFMNHPAMVAVLCAVVSLGVLFAVVMAGRDGGGVTPPVGGTPSAETERSSPPEEDEISSYPEESEKHTVFPEDMDPDEYIRIYLMGDIQLTLERFMVWSEEDGVSADGLGFQGECNSGELVQNGYNYTVYMQKNCEFQSVTVYALDMTEVASSTEPMIRHDLKGLYYVVLRIKIRHDTGVSCYDYVFPLTLCCEAEELNFKIIYPEETTLPPDESETLYEPTEPVGAYTLIPHKPSAEINEKYFLISMTATEPGKILEASANYRLYRLNGDEEELIHDYDVELAIYEEPESPDDYAVYETGVSLVWAKSELEAKGDTLTPGWYRVKYAQATLDFELTDETGKTPEVHPFAELSVPVSMYTSLTTEDMDLMERYERVYRSTSKIEKIWAMLADLTVITANPPENIRSGDGLGIHVTYPDGSKGRIHFWGEGLVYFYIDDGPWYQVPAEEVAALMVQITNLPSDPT